MMFLTILSVYIVMTREECHMHVKIITTFPFLFPPRPWERRMISPLRKGADGLLGVVIEPIINLDTLGTTCSFFEIDLIQEKMTQQEMPLRSRTLVQMDLCYDERELVWVAALRGDGHGPLAIYEVSREAGHPWMLILDANSLDQRFEANSSDPRYRTEKYLIAFWQRGSYFPLVFSEEDVTLMYDATLRWTHWQPAPVAQPDYQDLGTAYAAILHVFDEGCIIFTAECLYNAIESDPIYSKKGQGHWCFMVNAFAHDGTLLHHERLPEVTVPIRHLKVASSDLGERLNLFMHAAEGPRYGLERQRSCVVAVMMQELPERGKDRLTTEQQSAGTLQRVGGVYCLDMRGQLLVYHTDIVGEQMSLCSCGEQVIGTMLTDGERHIWGWSPFTTPQSYHAVPLSVQIQRATVVAPEEHSEDLWFWCIEEYQDGIRVVQRACQDLREMHSIWCGGISVPDWWYMAGTVERRPYGIVSYQQSLLVLGLNEDNRLQLLYFSKSVCLAT